MTQQTSLGVLPVVYANAGFASLYINGGQISDTSNTTLSIQPAQVRDSTNTYDMFLGYFPQDQQSVPTATTLNVAVNGVNGLDTGTFAANTVYAVYVIADNTGNNLTSTLLSLNATIPLLPFGYGIYRRIGWWSSNNAGQLSGMTQVGTGTEREYFYDTLRSVLSGGASTSFAAVDLSSAIPAIVTPVTFNYTYTPASASNNAQMRATGSTATVVNTIDAAAANAISDQITIFTGIAASKAEVDYKVTSSDTLTLLVYSFKDYL